MSAGASERGAEEERDFFVRSLYRLRLDRCHEQIRRNSF